jgi:hypothetical protein
VLDDRSIVSIDPVVSQRPLKARLAPQPDEPKYFLRAGFKGMVFEGVSEAATSMRTTPWPPRAEHRRAA